MPRPHQDIRRTALRSPNVVYVLFLIILLANALSSNLTLTHASFGILQLLALGCAVTTARSSGGEEAAAPWWLLSGAFVVLACTVVPVLNFKPAREPDTFAGANTAWLLAALVLRMVAALIVLAAMRSLSYRELNPSADHRLALDGVTVVGGGLMLTWYFLLGPVLTQSQAVNALADVGYCALTIGDLGLILGASTLLQRGTSSTGRLALLLLLLGALSFLAADALTAVSVAHPGFHLPRPLLNLLQLLPSPLLAAAAVEQRREVMVRGRETRPLRQLRPVTWLPYVALVGGFGLLAVAAARAGLYPWGGLVTGGIVMVAGVTMRQFLVLRDNRTLATTDPLTGLANRIRLREILEQAHEHTQRQGRQWAVMVIDLDDFKLVNDRYGHEVGDGLLVAFAGVLRQSLRPGDAAARLGGDEFAVVLQDILQAQDAIQTARHLLGKLQTPVDIHGRQISIKASVGIAVATNATPIGALMHQADLAMYRAKHSKSHGWHLYTPETPDLITDDASLRQHRARS